MDLNLKIVVDMPVAQLWTDSGFIDADRGQQLSAADIKDILTDVVFVVADVGMPLNWVDGCKTFDFWKNEVQEHVRDGAVSLDEAPGGYFYRATEWIEKRGRRIVLLEKHH